MLGLFLYSCWRSTGLKEGAIRSGELWRVGGHPRMCSPHGEEGGGEQDQPSPAQSLRHSYPHSASSPTRTKLPQDNTRRGCLMGMAVRYRSAPGHPPQSQKPAGPSDLSPPPRKPLLQPGLPARYLCEVIRDMEHPGSSPMTTPVPLKGAWPERRAPSASQCISGFRSQAPGAQSTRLDRFKPSSCGFMRFERRIQDPEGQRDKLKGEQRAAELRRRVGYISDEMSVQKVGWRKVVVRLSLKRSNTGAECLM
ncbi:neural-cadherin-like protein [Lates japonicus]|uniref:Neural-cadherin-like protein n=1 Tax=Lates japonicus TaxID=270547 RepID=A0AAD3RNT3_LATJO|nr:neural-cadherin-like protein [Lates japonicus]